MFEPYVRKDMKSLTDKFVKHMQSFMDEYRVSPLEQLLIFKDMEKVAIMMLFLNQKCK